MPGKHVRFSRTATFHSPATPALTYSSISPASSSASLTPPYYSGGLLVPSPYLATFPTKSTQKYSSSVRVHPLLQSSYSPMINFDLTQHPSTITSRHRGISMRVLAEPATKPSLPVMTIASPRLPWLITVTASYDPYVTVSDVLESIYRTLRVNITSHEFHSLPSEPDKHRVTAAYKQRYRCIRGSREYDDEKRRGVRRIDFLMGSTRFMGLSSAFGGSDVWVLNTT